MKKIILQKNNTNVKKEEEQNNFKDLVAGEVKPKEIEDDLLERYVNDEFMEGCGQCSQLQDKLFELRVEVHLQELKKNGIKRDLERQIQFQRVQYQQLLDRHNNMVRHNDNLLQEVFQDIYELTGVQLSQSPSSSSSSS